MTQEHEYTGGIVCVRCGMSIREQVSYKDQLGLTPVCLGMKRTNINYNQWYRDLLAASKKGQSVSEVTVSTDTSDSPIVVER